jgi:ferric-dicitrate binding protein FerR (iron transport regulator)
VVGAHNEWRNEVINFDNTSLAIAVKTLERWYGVKIETATGLEKCRITASFKKQSASEVLEIITSTLSLEFEEKNGGYYIKGGNCE